VREHGRLPLDLRGVSVNHHTLSDFRVAHEAAFGRADDAGARGLAARGSGDAAAGGAGRDAVRASAGAKSFRRERSLKQCLLNARQQVRRSSASWRARRDDDEAPGRGQVRAAEERVAQVRKALAHLKEIREIKETEEEREQARCSTTDPEARVMRMADGGYRPAYNVQLATDVEAGDRGRAGDQPRCGRGADRADARADRAPHRETAARAPGRRGLHDLGFDRGGGGAGAAVLAPPPPPRRARNPARPLRTTVRVSWPGAAHGQPQGKELYKQRAATAETTNADLRMWRGLGRSTCGARGRCCAWRCGARWPSTC